jgi:hypothetical protein
MKYILCVFLFSCVVSKLFTQTTQYFDQRAVGFQISLSYWDQLLPEGVTYSPTVYSLYTSWMLPRKKDRPYRWYLMLEPQWNPVLVGDRTEREIGILPGLGIQYRLTATTILYAEGGAGPKFISTETARQARGFLFTDNIIGGVRQRLFDLPIELRAHWRARHISNANFRQPNGGINSFFWGGGIYYLMGSH